MSAQTADPFAERMQRIEVLVQELESLADPVARAGAVELVQAILELHGTGLERILTAIQDSGASGSAIVEQLLRDDLVGSLLLLHNLHPLDPETRVRRALDGLRPHLGVQGGRAELLGLDGGVVRVQLDAGGHATPAALEETVRQAVLGAAPEISDVVFEGGHGGQTGSFIPLTAVFGVSPHPPFPSPASESGGEDGLPSPVATGEGLGEGATTHA